MRWAKRSEMDQFIRFKKVSFWKTPYSIAAGVYQKNDNEFQHVFEEDTMLYRILVWHGLPNTTPLEGAIHIHRYGWPSDGDPGKAGDIVWVDIHYHSTGPMNTTYIFNIDPPLIFEEDEQLYITSRWNNLTAGSVTWGDYVVILYLAEKR